MTIRDIEKEKISFNLHTPENIHQKLMVDYMRTLKEATGAWTALNKNELFNKESYAPEIFIYGAFGFLKESVLRIINICNDNGFKNNLMENLPYVFNEYMKNFKEEIEGKSE